MYSEKFNFGNDVYEVVVAADNELIGSSYYANGSIFLCKDNKKYLVYSERQDTGFDKFCKQSDQRRHEIYLQIFRDYEEQVRCGNIKILTEDDIKALSVKSNIYYWFKILAIGFFLVIGFNIRSCYNEDVKTKELKTPIVINAEVKRFELVSYRSPKHYYVTLRDIDTNIVYNDNYVSKNCNNYQSNKIGEQFNVQISNMKTKDETRKWLSFDNLTNVFCQ